MLLHIDKCIFHVTGILNGGHYGKLLLVLGAGVTALWVVVSNPLVRPRYQEWQRGKYKDIAEDVISNRDRDSSKQKVGPKGMMNENRVKDAWKKDVNSEVVSEAWFSFAGHIVQEFIYDTWYSHLTPDKEFPAEVRALLNSAFGRLAKRGKALNVHRLCNEWIEMVIEQLYLFRDTREELRNQNQWCEGVGIEKEIRAQLLKDANLHPSMKELDGHYKVLQKMSDSIVGLLQDTMYSDRILSRVVTRELLAGCVLRKVLQLCSPSNLLTWIAMLINAAANDNIHARGDVSRPSSEMRGVWQQKTKIEQFAAAESKICERGHSAATSAASTCPDDHGKNNFSEFPSQEGKSMAGETGDSPTQTTSTQDDVIPALKTCKFKGKPVCHVVNAEIRCSGTREFVVYSIRIGDDRGEWTVSRRYRHFEQLHRHIRNSKGYNIRLPPKRIFFHDVSPEYIEARRQALDEYLQGVLASPIFYSSDYVWDFFRRRSERFNVQAHMTTIPSKVLHSVSGAARDATHTVRVGANTVTQMIHKHGIASAAEMLAKGRKKLVGSFMGADIDLGRISSSDLDDLLMQDNQVSEKASSSPVGSILLDDESSSESDLDLESEEQISSAFYDLIDCVFQLENRGFFRRQTVNFVYVLFGLFDKIDSAFIHIVGVIRQESTIATWIAKLQSILWPGGKFAYRKDALDSEGMGKEVFATSETYLEPLPTRPDVNVLEVRHQLEELLANGPPSVLGKRLLGKVAYVEGVNDLLELLSSETMTIQIGYSALEILLKELFPEIIESLPVHS